LLQEVRITGNWEAWIEFFLSGVEETANQAVETARQVVALLNPKFRSHHGASD
jgi:Fic family protein